jgi:hypothetical protein
MLFLITLLLLGWVVNKLTFRVAGSYLLAIPLMFCLGSIVFTDLTYFLACLAAPYFSESLKISYYFTLLSSIALILIYYLKTRRNGTPPVIASPNENQKIEIFLMCICFLISYLFFCRHLGQIDSVIYRSLIFWDFPLHFSRINAFIMGNNFPPLDPFFGGAPLTYHFMYHLLEAIFITAGFKVSAANILVSVLSFSCLLMVMAKFMLSLGYHLKGALLTLLLFLTSSNLRFFYDLYRWYFEGRAYFSSPSFTEPFINSQFSRSYYEFYGQHFSLFYFLEERRLGFACLFMMLIFYIISFNRENLGKKQQVIIGLLTGGFLFWHFHAALLITLVLFLTWLSKKQVRPFLLPAFLISAVIISIQACLIRYWQSDPSFFEQGLEKFTGFDFSFPSPDREGSFIRTIIYLALAYGVKLICLPEGLKSIKKISEITYYLLLYALSGIFIAFSLKLNSGHIHENHKWIVLSSPALNIIGAIGALELYAALKEKFCSKFVRIPVAGSFLFFLTYAGLVENLPFFTAQRYGKYGDLSSPIAKYINLNFPQEAVFIAEDWTLVHLSGRAVYISSRSHTAVGLALDRRMGIQEKIFQSKSKFELCGLLLQEKIQGLLYAVGSPNFISLDNIIAALPDAYADFPSDNQKIRIVNVKIACGNP